MLKNEQKNRKLKLEKLFRLINQSKGGKRASGDGNNTPYDAFTNYMNILGDFISRVNSLYPVDMDNEEQIGRASCRERV